MAIWLLVSRPAEQSSSRQEPDQGHGAGHPAGVGPQKERSALRSADLPCSVDHGIIGLMYPARGPFVHQSWWWRSRQSIHENLKLFEPIPNGFRMTARTPSANSAPYKLMRLSGAKAGDIIVTT